MLAWAIVAVTFAAAAFTFNSLFEMHYVIDLPGNPAPVPFNSLFEMPVELSLDEVSCRKRFFQFSI